MSAAADALTNSPRIGRKASDTFHVVGSRIEHADMEPFTMFVKGSRNFRRTPVLYKYPRYPPTDVLSPRLQYEEEHQRAMDQFTLTQTKPPPPPSHSAQPFPTGDLMTMSGTAGNMFDILRGARCTAVEGSSPHNHSSAAAADCTSLHSSLISPPLTVRGELRLSAPPLPPSSYNNTLTSMPRLSPRSLMEHDDTTANTTTTGVGSYDHEVSPTNMSCRSMPLPPLSFGKGHDCASTRSPLQRGTASVTTSPRHQHAPPPPPPPVVDGTAASSRLPSASTKGASLSPTHSNGMASDHNQPSQQNTVNDGAGVGSRPTSHRVPRSHLIAFGPGRTKLFS